MHRASVARVSEPSAISKCGQTVEKCKLHLATVVSEPVTANAVHLSMYPKRADFFLAGLSPAICKRAGDRKKINSLPRRSVKCRRPLHTLTAKMVRKKSSASENLQIRRPPSARG